MGNKKTNGQSRSNPQNNQTVRISDQIYLIIGFEVNVSSAYNVRTNTQNLDIDNGGDYGHAFFFTIKNGRVVTFFSFGPRGGASPYLIESLVGIDEHTGRRPATTSYAITEIATLFKFKISQAQLDRIKYRADLTKKGVMRGLVKYTVYVNDTCAETARDILKNAGISTPYGGGRVVTPSRFANNITTSVDMVNPYSWHYHIKTKYGEGYRYTNGYSLLNGYRLPESKHWTLEEEQPVPSNMASDIRALPIKSDLSE